MNTILVDLGHNQINDDLLGYVKFIMSNREFTENRLCFGRNKAMAGEVDLDINSLGHIEIINRGSNDYRNALSDADYIIMDGHIPDYFHKKDNQTIINFWFDKDCEKVTRKLYGNLDQKQRTILYSDYIFLANETIYNNFLNSYMVEGLYKGKFYIGSVDENVYQQINSLIYENDWNVNLNNPINSTGKRKFIHVGSVDTEYKQKLVNGYVKNYLNLDEKPIVSIDNGINEHNKPFLRKLIKSVDIFLKDIELLKSISDSIEEISLIFFEDNKMLEAAPSIASKSNLIILPDHIIHDLKNRKDIKENYEIYKKNYTNIIEMKEDFLYRANPLNRETPACVLECSYNWADKGLNVFVKFTYDRLWGIDTTTMRPKISNTVYDEKVKFLGNNLFEVSFTVPEDEVFSGKKNRYIKISFTAPDGEERNVNLLGKVFIDHKEEETFYSSNEKVIKNDKYKSSILIRVIEPSLLLTVRDANVLDTKLSNLKVAHAYKESKKYKDKNIILIYEKDSSRYEESGKVVYERLIDLGYDNAYFILDKNCPYRNEIPSKYKKNIIDRFSMKHIIYYFAAKTFIGSEAVTHAMEVGTANRQIERQKEYGDFDYVFLQHGIMYMVSLDADARKYLSKPKYAGRRRIVVSSKLEMEHFTSIGKLPPEDLYLSGLPKFDKNVINDNPDKIVVMLTYKPWEYTKCLTDFPDTDYCKEMEKIVDSVPDELKDKLVVLIHPLIKASAVAKKNEISFAPFISEADRYDDVLKDVRLLITDYSSIVYDSFYRGANAIFYWEMKDKNMEHYGKKAHLMLTEDLAFGDVFYNTDGLSEGITKAYDSEQSEEYVRRYREIVNFHDNNNTDRLIQMMKDDGVI